MREWDPLMARIIAAVVPAQAGAGVPDLRACGGADGTCDPPATRRILVPVSPPSSFAIDVPAALLDKARRGALRAFEQLYRLFERPVYTLAARMLGDVDEAMEVLHDAMLRVFQRIGDFRGESPFWGWLRQIAVNEALMKLRRRNRVEYVDEVPEPDFEPAALLPPSAAESGALARALEQVSPTTRSVLWLYHAEGYTHEEIAGLMGRTTSFSKTQLLRGTRKLRELLKVDLEATADA
jgi:RNA polymerase sigma-70 factor (ECF subfamily)